MTLKDELLNRGQGLLWEMSGHGGKRKRSGRKRLGHVQLVIRLTPESVAWIRDRAAISQTTLSNIVQRCIDSAINDPPP